MSSKSTSAEKNLATADCLDQIKELFNLGVGRAVAEISMIMK